MTVSELVDCLDHLECTPAGRPGKVVSDALRWEMRRGRVRRIGRGRYAAGRIPRSTRWWMKDQIHQWEESERQPQVPDVGRTLGREILTFVDGETLGAGVAWRPGMPTRWPPWARTEECLAASARLLRELHDAAASFAPPEGAVWRRHPSGAVGADEIVCHGDIGPHNTVYRDGMPVAFIDWDTIRPELSTVELGSALWRTTSRSGSRLA